MTDHKLQTYFFLATLLVVIVLVFFTFRPYFDVLLLAGTAAFIFKPLQDKIMSLVRRNVTVAAILTTFIVLLLVLVPLTLVGVQVFRETLNLYSSLSLNGATVGFSERLQVFVAEYLPRLSPLVPRLDVGQFAQRVIGLVIEDLGAVFTSVTRLFFALLLSLLALYYFLKDGHKLRKYLIVLSPLPDAYDNQVFQKLSVAVSSVIKGSLIVGIVQGVLTGVGFAIFGIPNPALWGSIAAVASLIPTIGTSLVSIPAIIYLFVVGPTSNAIGLIIWAIVAVGLVDNFLGPKLIEQGVNIHPFLILLSVLGGIGLFGPIGFLAGPLILSWLFALIDIYPSLVRPDTHKH